VVHSFKVDNLVGEHLVIELEICVISLVRSEGVETDGLITVETCRSIHELLLKDEDRLLLHCDRTIDLVLQSYGMVQLVIHIGSTHLVVLHTRCKVDLACPLAGEESKDCELETEIPQPVVHCSSTLTFYRNVKELGDSIPPSLDLQLHVTFACRLTDVARNLALGHLDGHVVESGSHDCIEGHVE